MASALESAETSVESSSDQTELTAYKCRCTEFNLAVKSLIQETPDIPPQDLDVLACQKVIAQEPKGIPFHYLQALRLITGNEDLDEALKKHIANKLNDDKVITSNWNIYIWDSFSRFLYLVYSHHNHATFQNAVDDILRLGRVSNLFGKQSWREQFASAIKKRESGICNVEQANYNVLGGSCIAIN